MNQFVKSFRFRQICIIGVGIACFGCVGQKPTGDKAKQDVNSLFLVPNMPQRDLPVIAVFVNKNTPSVISLDTPKQKLDLCPIVLMVWSDGIVLYSNDFLQGGEPYRIGTIDRTILDSFFTQLHSSISWDQSLFCDYVAPDASFTSISLQDKGHILYLESWHELVEANGISVCTVMGQELLDGRDIRKVIAKQPEGYKQFRMLWDKIRSESKTLIPKKSESITPTIEWQKVEKPAKPLVKDWNN